MRITYIGFVAVLLLMTVGAGCTTVTTFGGRGTTVETLPSRAPAFSDQLALSQAIESATATIASDFLALCVDQPITTDVVVLPSPEASAFSEFARAQLQTRLSAARCKVVDVAQSAGAPPEPTAPMHARLIVRAWGWEVEGYESTTSTYFIFWELRRTREGRGRVRARASVDLVISAETGSRVRRADGISTWRRIKTGEYVPTNDLPVVDEPSPARRSIPAEQDVESEYSSPQ